MGKDAGFGVKNPVGGPRFFDFRDFPGPGGAGGGGGKNLQGGGGGGGGGGPSFFGGKGGGGDFLTRFFCPPGAGAPIPEGKPGPDLSSAARGRFSKHGIVSRSG